MVSVVVWCVCDVWMVWSGLCGGFVCGCFWLLFCCVVLLWFGVLFDVDVSIEMLGKYY